MWGTLLKVSYEDFELPAENVVHYKNLTASFQQYFTENNIIIRKHIPSGGVYVVAQVP